MKIRWFSSIDLRPFLYCFGDFPLVKGIPLNFVKPFRAVNLFDFPLKKKNLGIKLTSHKYFAWERYHKTKTLFLLYP